jgi:hypothetical protein
VTNFAFLDLPVFPRQIAADGSDPVTVLLGLLYAWLQGGREDEVRAWVDAQTKTDGGLLTFLSSVRGWGAVNGVVYYPLRRRELEKFLDFDLAIRRLEIISRNDDASEADRVRASELLEASKQSERE